MKEFTLEAIDLTNDLIEAVFCWREGKIPGASVVDLVAAEGFFELGEAIPGVSWVFGGGDAPEIEGFGATIFGVEDHLNEEDDASVDFAVGVAACGMGIETSGFVVVDEGSGEWKRLGCFAIRGGFWGCWGEFGNVKGGKARFKLVSQMRFGLGLEMVLFADRLKQGSKN